MMLTSCVPHGRSLIGGRRTYRTTCCRDRYQTTSGKCGDLQANTSLCKGSTLYELYSMTHSMRMPYGDYNSTVRL